MKRFLLRPGSAPAILLGLALASPAQAQLNSTYRLVFAEEFNGTAVDTAKWAVASPSWTMPNSASAAAASQVSVADGVLTLNATRTATSGTTQFSSGSISSYGIYNFDGGYVEASIDLPTTPGSWPAFWGLYSGWPPEADIMEYPLTTDGGTNGYTNSFYHTAFHYTNSGGAAASGAGQVNTNQNLSTTGSHIFAMDWVSDTSVKFFMDGTQRSSFTSGVDVAEMVNMYMILDYAVGGWPGTPTTAQWPLGASDQTKVDWVRVWQVNPNGDTTSNWNINGGGALATNGNWANSISPAYGNQTAIFGRVGTAASATVTLPNWRVFGNMIFNGGGDGTTAYTIGASSNLIQLAGQPLGGSPVGASVQASLSSTVSQNIGAKVQLWSGTTARNDMTGGQTLNFNSQVSGNGALNVTGVGTTVLNATNIHTGGTNIGTAQEAAVLRASANNALGSGPVVIGPSGNASTARLELGGGYTQGAAIDFCGRTNSSVAIQSLSGNNTLAGGITSNVGGNIYQIQSDAGTLTLGGTVQAGSGTRTFTLQGAGSGVVSGIIQNGGGTVALTKEGAGIWSLTGPNTYTGVTNVNAGTLRVTGAGAVASYSFDNVSGSTIVNGGSGGAAMNGTLTAGATVVAGGRTGNAVSLAGGSYVNINNPITDLGNNGNWTISAWVKTTTAGSTILSKANGDSWGTGNSVFYLGDGTAAGSGGIPSAVRYAGGFFQGSASAVSVVNNVWHMVTYVNSGGVCAIYIDGVAQALSTGNSGFGNADVGTTVRLGFTTNTFPADGTVHFNGLLDDVQFYNQALSAAQIAMVYQNQVPAGSLASASGITIASGATFDVNGVSQTIGTLAGPGTLTKNGAGTLTLSGANSFTGSATINGGTLYATAGNAANNRALSFANGITVNSGATLQSSANALFGWDGTQDRPITVNAGGTLAADGGAAGDVGVGTVTLAGGTLASSAASSANGSWRFDGAADKLLVTENSTASATNVKFGNASASIEVAAGKTLNFTGTVTNATSGGISYLTKTGAGTLTLGGANTCTGATTLSAGTLAVNGSIAAGGSVTTMSGTVLKGTGTIAAATTINGTHQPGSGAGTQTFGNLSYRAAAHLAWELTGNSDASGFDRVISTGAVTVSSGAVVDVALNSAGSGLDLSNAFWTQSRSWPVITAASVSGGPLFLTVSADPLGRLVSDYGTLALQQNAASVALIFTPYTPQQIWLRQYFGSGWNNPVVAGNPADPDHDGATNLVEWALGLNPTAADAVPWKPGTAGMPVQTMTSVAGQDHLSLQVRRPIGLTDVTYRGKLSDDQISWSDAQQGATTSNGDGTETVTFLDTDPVSLRAHRFIRLEITQ